MVHGGADCLGLGWLARLARCFPTRHSCYFCCGCLLLLRCHKTINNSHRYHNSTSISTWTRWRWRRREKWLKMRKESVTICREMLKYLLLKSLEIETSQANLRPVMASWSEEFPDLAIFAESNATFVWSRWMSEVHPAVDLWSWDLGHLFYDLRVFFAKWDFAFYFQTPTQTIHNKRRQDMLWASFGISADALTRSMRSRTGKSPALKASWMSAQNAQDSLTIPVF